MGGGGARLDPARRATPGRWAAIVVVDARCGNAESGKGTTPVGGVTGVVGGAGSGGGEPNPLSGYGGGNRRGASLRDQSGKSIGHSVVSGQRNAAVTKQD